MAISGRSNDDCLKALIAANNVPDLAFELLMSGAPIPDGPLGGPGGEDDGDDMYGDEGDEGAGAGGNPAAGLAQYNLSPETLQAIQALVNNPSFPVIRQRMMND